MILITYKNVLCARPIRLMRKDNTLLYGCDSRNGLSQVVCYYSHLNDIEKKLFSLSPFMNTSAPHTESSSQVFYFYILGTFLLNPQTPVHRRIVAEKANSPAMSRSIKIK